MRFQLSGDVHNPSQRIMIFLYSTGVKNVAVLVLGRHEPQS